ncbi:MAG TPA: hypothetical protein VFV63_03020 [Ilumatobacteraceae bacterium]|nr:hypothetical protein [Ilumatobacteraceae bacterium]
MTLLLVCIVFVFAMGLRSGTKRAEVRRALPMFIGCCVVAIAYLSQRIV